ncbi:MAG: hypothetical protein K0S39_5493, partial [Paenibacillus sp.]|nr:hypothetical protein [Paenibacillus sp.]
MSIGMMILQLTGFGFVFWLGLYMINREIGNIRLSLTGIGLALYAVCLCTTILITYSSSEKVTSWLSVIQDISLLLTLICLMLTLLSLKREGTEMRLAFILPVCMHICSGLWILTSINASVNHWFLLGNGAGLLWFGIMTTAVEIKKQGEAWLPDFFRSLDYSIFFTLLFSGLVILAAVMGEGLTLTMVALLAATTALSITLQVFLHPLRALLDHIAFVTFPKLREESSRLRAVEQVTFRVDETIVQDHLDVDSLFRFTRNALSHFGDLQRLASNPLTQLKLIDRRLHSRGRSLEVLERANELKAVLTEAIEQLKPRQ